MQEELPDGDAQQAAGNAVDKDMGSIFIEVIAKAVGIDGWVLGAGEKEERGREKGKGRHEKRKGILENSYIWKELRKDECEPQEGTEHVHR